MSHGDDFGPAMPPDWTRKKLKYLAHMQSGTSITAESISEFGE